MLAALPAFAADFFELPPINYSATQPKDAVTELQRRIAAGALRFEGSDREIVTALLRELRVPVESQVVVFSKTSLQRQRITPEHPRAIFFSDTCYVGWVPGGLVEVTTIDPALGPIFYALNPASLRKQSTNAFVRDEDCLRCHGGLFVRDVPAVLVRSLFTADSGEPLLQFGSVLVDSRTPFTNRWGGWYVSGRHGEALHRGNTFAQETDGKLAVDLAHGANRTNLAELFDTSAYLTNTSDIVALLVLEHQTQMQNTLTRASMNCRRMLDYQRNLQRDLKEPFTEELTYDSVKSVFESEARQVVDDLLFYGEAALPDGVEGAAGFQRAFQAGVRRSASGDSLKDFSLRGRMFRNRCSYLIYSELFLALPAQLKDRVYQRLERILIKREPDPRYKHLDADECARIVAILLETHPDLRERWKLLAGA